MKLTPVILIDTREQDPFTFANLPSEPGTLDTGDYSVRGLEHLVAVERKSLDDLLACVGRERDRFKRELQRLRAYRFRLLIVETTAADLEQGAYPGGGEGARPLWRSKLTPAHVLGSLAAWTAQYSLPVWLGGTHDESGRFAERFLYQAARTVAGEAEAVFGKLKESA
ncbi:MAG: ERCC4 domain-containing protein [Phycisphaerae bacterium]|nr:ERCC4 domain-containing protein [Phycisphaerae bacterium]NUQ07965.1 ERCC4 domain-containing protein [Phycisphaerae bacterium]